MLRSTIWLALLAALVSGNAIERSTGRSVFNYRRNGLKVEVKIVPAVNGTVSTSDEDDGFPKFPFKDVGHCIVDFSATCVQKRVARFLDLVNQMKEITLLGQSVKLVRRKDLPKERVDEQRTMVSAAEKIDNTVEEFFDSFALRVTLPRWHGKKNQIDVMADDVDVVEGRGGKGGGKGGKGGGKKKGGGCKKMMMMMMIGLKAKMMGMIGMAAMKSMFMSGMSLMISKMMLIMQFMSKKGGMFGGGGGGGGYGGGGGGGNFKEIVLLTKGGSYQGGGGGGGGGGYSAPSSSYGAPPSSSYGAPPSSSYGAPPSSSYGAPPSDSYGAPPQTGGGGGGGYDYSGGGGGGGWARSFDRRPMSNVKDNANYETDNDPSATIPDEAIDEAVALKPLSHEKLDQETKWNYTTESTLPDQIKASQEREKTKEITQKDKPTWINFSRQVYARRWKNYVESKTRNTNEYDDYDDKE